MRGFDHVLYEDGFRARTGHWALTTGVFLTVTRYDLGVHTLPVFVQEFLGAHESAHRKYHHGLWSALFFFAAPLLRPMFEAQADRYAIRAVGRESALRALMILMPIARTSAEARVYGRDAGERMARAGG